MARWVRAEAPTPLRLLVVAGLSQVVGHLLGRVVERLAAAGAGLQRLVELDAEEFLDLRPIRRAGTRQATGVELLQADRDQAVARIRDAKARTRDRHRARFREFPLGIGTSVPLQEVDRV